MKCFGSIGLCMAVITVFSTHTASAETIRMGYFNIKPHMYETESVDRPAGAAVSYFEMVAEKMGCDVVWIGPLPHARLVHYLEQGEVIDGDPLMSMTAERKKFLYYPDQPFYLAKPNFVVSNDNPLSSIVSTDDVKGYVLGQFYKAANSRFVEENKSLFRFEIISSGRLMFEQHLYKLLTGRVDAIHTLDEFTLLYQAKKCTWTNR